MDQEDIRIEQVKIGELVEFAENAIAKARAGQLLPITMRRAVAHRHNPYADVDDVGLLVAYSGDECVGYFGIMPVLLKHEDMHHKVHWFSTWYVSPRLRGKAVGSRLMEAALALNQDYLIVGSGPARKVCRRFGFMERSLYYYILDPSGMQRLNPVRLIYRFWRKALQPLGVRGIPIDNRFTRAFEALVAPLTKPIFYRWLWPSARADLGEIQIKEVCKLSKEAADLVHRIPETGLIRGIEAINWMLMYPWVVEPGESATEDLDFYFSDVRQVFRNIAVEIYASKERRLLGFVVFSLSAIGGKLTLKVLDHRCADPADQRYIWALAVRYAREYTADRLEIPEHLTRYLGSGWFPRIMLARKTRIYQAKPKSESSPLAQAWPEITFDYTDGDMPFS